MLGNLLGWISDLKVLIFFYILLLLYSSYVFQL